MSRLKQIFQNAFIRFIGLISVLFSSLFGLIKSIFSSAGKILGITDSSSVYFLESDSQQIAEDKSENNKTPVETVKTPEIAIGDRRRPKKSNMDDFMRMAGELKNN